MEKGTAILFSNFIFIPLFKRLNSIYFPPSSLFFDEQILPSWQEKIKTPVAIKPAFTFIRYMAIEMNTMPAISKISSKNSCKVLKFSSAHPYRLKDPD